MATKRRDGVLCPELDPGLNRAVPGYNSDLERFSGFDAQVVGISVDSIFSHIAWQKRDIGAELSPRQRFLPPWRCIRKYGVLREGDPIPGISDRAVFIVGKDGKLKFAKVYPISQVPDVEEVFEVLKKL